MGLFFKFLFLLGMIERSLWSSLLCSGLPFLLLLSQFLPIVLSPPRLPDSILGIFLSRLGIIWWATFLHERFLCIVKLYLLMFLLGTLKLGMVSIRRRKLLGLCAGRNSFLTPLPKFSDNGYTQESRIQSMKPVSVHPMPSIDFDQKNEKPFLLDGVGSFYPSASAASGENHVKPFPEVKRRKRHRRKHSENQETCVMRGVYFKNMKWQAAIKVDKKQIHLGTVGSQEEAARLYDRAAFMCGREPNFELPEDEKQELSKFNWEEFLAFTRSAINNKKHRRTGAGSRRKSEPLTVKSEWESEQGINGLSGSEDGGEPDTPES